MQFNSRQLPDGAVLESGGDEPSADIQLLNEGAVFGGPYAGLRVTRHRGVGGTPNRWNTGLHGMMSAKFAPLDDWDLETTGAGRLPGWPVD